MPHFDYKVIRTRRFSGLSISIHQEKGVVVKAPFWIPDIAIRKFVEDKSEWVSGHLQRILQSAVPAKQYEEGEKHLYFGREYTLTFSHVDVPQRTSAQINGESLEVVVFSGHQESKKKEETRDAILRLYLETGIAALTEKVNFYCNQIGVSYSQIEIKKVSSIWGSCSPSNKLSFNRKLIMAPHDVVDYVVIHEVCHLVHRDHSSRFWGLVARYDPDYKKHRRWLHRNHAVLTI